ncbi:toprim domain-containing protein [Pararobbsia alpina]|uniref:toprim domain-containing protein n=1 Tax=Pararobbsia alpina TaxID=621374 RepID=UPI001583E17F|nr:toprim domain-containing protein [Pararobbsia alpina]
MWLYKAGISNAEIEGLGIYWNRYMQRVVIPVRDELGHVVYWQARTLDKTNPKKYLNPHVDKRRLVAKFGSGSLLVLTEDLLSAYKVATRGNVAAWCLLGTKITDFIATGILASGKPVTVWLDPDAAGQTNATKIIKQLRAYGVTVRNVVSEKDPKLLGREEIEWTLKAGGAGNGEVFCVRAVRLHASS